MEYKQCAVGYIMDCAKKYIAFTKENISIKKLKEEISEPPFDVAHSYIFIVSRRDLAINIITAGYNAIYIGNEGDSVDDLIEYMNVNEYRGLNMQHQ